MNLYILIKTIKGRNVRPPIKIDGNELDLSSVNQMDYIIFLADIWDKLVPDENQSLEEKQYQIAMIIAGKRNAYEFTVLMDWLNKRADIETSNLAFELKLLEGR